MMERHHHRTIGHARPDRRQKYLRSDSSQSGEKGRSVVHAEVITLPAASHVNSAAGYLNDNEAGEKNAWRYVSSDQVPISCVNGGTWTGNGEYSGGNIDHTATNPSSAISSPKQAEALAHYGPASPPHSLQPTTETSRQAFTGRTVHPFAARETTDLSMSVPRQDSFESTFSSPHSATLRQVPVAASFASRPPLLLSPDATSEELYDALCHYHDIVLLNPAELNGAAIATTAPPQATLPPGWEQVAYADSLIYLDHCSREAHEEKPWRVWRQRAQR